MTQRLVARPEIKTFKDLKGKSIGVGSVGGGTDFLALQIVKHYGLDPQKDITIVGAGAGMKFPALLAGAVDAAMLDPIETIKAQKKGFNELARAADVYHLPSIGLTTTDRHIRERREMVKKVIRGTLKGLLYVRENKEESVAHMIKEWGYHKEIAPIYYDMEIEATTKDGKPSDQSILNEIEAARLAGMIKESVPISKVADFSILQEVQKELGL